MSVCAFLLILGLVVRITRLFVDDGITKPIRDWFLEHSVPGGEIVGSGKSVAWVENVAQFRHKISNWFHELLDCPWCTSVHVAFWVLLVANETSQVSLNWFWFAATWATIAWLTGLAATLIGVMHGAETLEAKAAKLKS